MNQKESILIIDDDESICRRLALILGKKGYETETAKTAQEALEKARERSFNVALIDIRLPDMEGTVLLGKLKKAYPEMVCIIITGYASLQNVIMTIKMDTNGYFVKPLVMEEVIYRIEEALAKQRLERKLKESEQKYRTLYESSKDGIDLCDIEGHILDANQAFLDMLGYTIEEVRRLTYQGLTPKKWQKMATDIIKKQTIVRGYSNEHEKEYIKKDGTLLPITIRSWLIKDKKGRPVGTWAIIRDITERKQAEERVKHLNLVLRAIRSVNQLIVKEKDRERLLKGVCNNLIGTQSYYSAWIALLDESGKLETYAEAGIGKALLPMVELLKKGELIVCGQKSLKQQEVVTIKDPASTCHECPLLKEHSGRRAMTIRLEYNGKVYGFVSVSIPAHIADDQEEQSLFKEVAGDIAFSIHNIELNEEHKQAEENVKNAKDELQIILDSVPAIIFYKDIEGKIIRANKTLADSLKVPVEDIVGKTTEELFPKEQAENMRKDDKEVMISGKPKRNIIETYTTPDGVRWAITDKMPYREKKGKVTGVISLSKDITVQRKSEEELQQSYQRLKKTMDAAIDTMSKIIEAKDPYTSGHQHRVCQLAVPLARELGLSEYKIEGIRIASLIHDIGKISLPTEILSKPGKLNDIEFSLIKGHSQTGYDILRFIDFSYPIAEIVLQHHERLNGSGYPNNLKDDEIILEAKIIGIADVVEAMSSFRPYRPALGVDKALEEIIQNRGTLYDPEVVDVCLKLFKEKEFKFK